MSGRGGVTDTARLPLPSELVPVDRQTYVAGQEVVVDAHWWNDRLAELHLPGRPIVVTRRADGAAVLTRSAVWAVWPGPVGTDDDVLRLLWHAIAWGAGSRRRMCLRRMRSVAEDINRSVDLLRRAAQHARADPEQAYAILHPNGHGAISGLGPAFGTKFLYFAGGGHPDHPSLILDSRVAFALHRHGWSSLGTGGGWPASTYERYVTLARRWADELSRSGNHHVAADQVELWLFGRR